MSEFPFQRVLAFVAKVHPFDTLAPEELEQAVGRMRIAFFPKGEVVIAQGGEPSGFLYLIQSGSARVSLVQDDGQEILVDQRGEGDSFGSLSLLQGSRALFQVTAREDLICYLLPAAPFKGLVEGHEAFERHYRFSLARNIESARRGTVMLDTQAAGLEAVGLDTALMQSPVRELMAPQVVACAPSMPVRAAAARMTAGGVGSILVLGDDGRPLGILTDGDLRARVLAAGRSLEAPAGEVMTRPVVTIDPQAPALEALLTMSHHGLHHLVVLEGGRAVGMLSERDLMSTTGGSPVGVVRGIAGVASVDELVALHRRIDRVLEMLLRAGGSARHLLELVTEFNDRLTTKLIELTEAEMEGEGLGRPPVPYVWLALGSEGRKEQTLRTDQDNALIYANVPAEREERIKGWFLAFAERMVEGLVRCGFPRCQGGVMASNPKWCQSERDWQRTFLGWVKDPNPQTLRLASIFFDFRAIYAEAGFEDNLVVALGRAIEGNRLFLRYMARNGLYNRPPLGFLRQFVVEKSGEHKNQLNLKLSGLTPLVDGARVMALDQGAEQSASLARLDERAVHVHLTNTLDRLEEVTRRGLLKPEHAADLGEAFSFITLLRIGQHLEARARGEVPDNFLDPARLGGLQRKMLKESFAVIGRMQEQIEHRYQTWLVT